MRKSRKRTSRKRTSRKRTSRKRTSRKRVSRSRRRAQRVSRKLKYLMTNGQGTMTYPDGREYVGEFFNGERNGQGTMTGPSGCKYVGEWKNDKMDGQGTGIYPSGNKYVGGWKNDKRSGYGTMTYAKVGRRPTYVGEWIDGMRNGHGTMTWPDREYIGAWKNDKMDGHGVMILKDGREYAGEWRNSKTHGQGTMTWPNGDKYVGEWKNDKMDGHGTMTWLSGRKYMGAVRNNVKNGLGTMTWPNGDKYIGEFRDGIFDGYGLEISPGCFGTGDQRFSWRVIVDGTGECPGTPASIKNIKDALVSVEAPKNIIDFILNEYSDEYASNISGTSTTHSSHGATKRLEKREIRKHDAAIKSHYEDILGHPWDSSRLGPLPLFAGLSLQDIRDRTRVWEHLLDPFEEALERTKIDWDAPPFPSELVHIPAD